MEKSIKMLAICVIIGCLLISGVLFYNKYMELKQSRYYFSRVSDGSPMVFDNLTGKYYYRSSGEFYEADLINGTINKHCP